MSLKVITSRSNPEIKRLHALAQSAKDRRKLGLSVLDGAHLLRAALEARWPLHAVFVSEQGQSQAEIAALLAQISSAQPTLPITLLPDALFASISPVDAPSGVLALITYPASVVAVPDQPAVEGSVLLLEGVQDPGNLGTIVRTAAAAGIREVLLSSGCTQAWSPRALRAGMGGHFVLTIREQVDLQAYLATYAGPVVATSLGAGSQDVYACDLAQPVAWLFGSEGQGLSDALMAYASVRVRIPMMTGVESLNVAAAVAVCLFEQVRQHAQS